MQQKGYLFWIMIATVTTIVIVFLVIENRRDKKNIIQQMNDDYSKREPKDEPTID